MNSYFISSQSAYSKLIGKMIRWIILAILFVSATRGDTVVTKNSVPQVQQLAATDSTYYYQQYPTQGQYYGYNNGYNWNANNFVQKQDFGGDGGDDSGLATGLAVTALVVAAIILVVLAIPTILAIAAIIYTAVGNGGTGTGTDLKEMFNFGKSWMGSKRSMSALRTFISSENCIERISCAIGQRTLGRRRRSRGAKDTKDEYFRNGNNTVDGPAKKSSFVQRISRAFNDDDCAAYKCSIFSYFS